MPRLRARAKTFALLFISGCLVTTTLTGQGVVSSDETQEGLASRAEEAQRSGNYRAAAQIYQEMLKTAPHSAEVRANLGTMYHLLGEYAAAIPEFRTALQEDPHLFVPNLFLGLDLLQIEKPREAVSYLERAHEINPRDANVVLSLGRAYRELGSFLKARTSYDEAVQLNPGNPRAWFGLGSTYLSLEDEGVAHLGKAYLNSAYFQALGAESFVQEGRLNDAVAIYHRLLETRSSPSCLRADFGFVLMQLGRSTDAEGEFQTELTNSPRCSMARLGLARIAVGHGDMTTAVGELSHVWQADPNYLSANAPMLWQGLSTEQLEGLETSLKGTPVPDGAPPELRDALLAALARWRKDPVETFAEMSTNFLAGSVQPAPDVGAQRVSQARAAQFYSQGKYTACQESLKPALSKLGPQNSLVLAECAYDSGDFRTSFLASQQAVDADAQSPAAWYWRIKSSQVLAVNALVQAGKAEPNSPAVHVMLGDVYRERKDFSEAESEYRKAIELKPGDVSAHLGLAATFYNAFLLDKALPELKAVLQLAPQNPEANFMMGDILVLRHQFAEAEPYAKASISGDA
ncbi:MAG: tetratricopeptide repeat protein [Terriglobia bacterium]